MAMLIQYLSAKLGIVTDHTPPEVCRERFPRCGHLGSLGAGRGHGDGDRHRRVPRRGDRAEPALRRAAAAGRPDHRRRSRSAILELQTRGFRRFELAITALLGIIFAGFLYETLRIGPSVHGLARAALVPHLQRPSSLYLAVGIIGATVMPHVIYLHSALTKDRVPMRNDRERRGSCASSALDVLIALGLAGLVNLAMLAVAAKLFHTPALSSLSTIQQAHHQFGTLVGGGAALAFAVALLASGASSSSVGTYAGQVVMAGFINLRIPLLAPPRGDDDPGADRPRDRRQPDRRARAQPGRSLVRHPLRARSPS